MSLINKDVTLYTNIQRYSLNDGPGMRTTVFIKGCELKCPWCHNPETQSFKPDIFFKAEKCKSCGICQKVCPSDAIDLTSPDRRIIRRKCSLCLECVKNCPYKALEQIGLPVDEEKLLKEILSDKVFYQNSKGGITISGGEPLTHPEFVLKILKRVKKTGINTCLDTCGYANWDDLEMLIPYLDLVLYDIKCIDDELHKSHTGVSNKLIIENFVKLVNSGAKVRVRIPIIPGFNYTIKQIEKIADFVERYPIEGVDILPYHNFGRVKYRMLDKPYGLKDRANLTKEDVKPYQNIFLLRNIKTTIGG